MVIDSLHKQSAVEEVFQNAGAENDDAAWIGYTNRKKGLNNKSKIFFRISLYHTLVNITALISKRSVFLSSTNIH